MTTLKEAVDAAVEHFTVKAEEMAPAGEGKVNCLEISDYHNEVKRYRFLIPTWAGEGFFPGQILPRNFCGGNIEAYATGHARNDQTIQVQYSGSNNLLDHYLNNGFQLMRLTAKELFRVDNIPRPVNTRGLPFDERAHKACMDAVKLAQDFKNFLDTDTEFNVSVSEKDTKQIAFDYRGKRYFSTISRFIRRKTDLKPSDHALEEFDKYVSTQTFDLESNIEVVWGQALIDAFKEMVGGSSCMAKANLGHLVQMYGQNPDKIHLVTLHIENKSARALLWHGAEDPNGNKYTYLDRVYPTSDGEMRSYLETWAEQKGYEHRQGSTCPLALKINLNVSCCTHFPYTDSFTHIGPVKSKDGTETAWLYTSKWVDYQDIPGGVHRLDSQSGYGPNQNRACTICGNYSRLLFPYVSPTNSRSMLCEKCSKAISQKVAATLVEADA